MTVTIMQTFGIFSLLWLMFCVPAYADSRQAEVAKRGAEMMPFALEKTQHQFTKTSDGGIQRVIARDAQDKPQIQLIQTHLRQLASKFQQSDYSGPEAIHGADMPGLVQLKTAKADSMQIIYTAEANGASLTFKTADPQLLAALHTWFDAQVRDHGHDAMAMHHQHHHP